MKMNEKQGENENSRQNLLNFFHKGAARAAKRMLKKGK